MAIALGQLRLLIAGARGDTLCVQLGHTAFDSDDLDSFRFALEDISATVRPGGAAAAAGELLLCPVTARGLLRYECTHDGTLKAAAVSLEVGSVAIEVAQRAIAAIVTCTSDFSEGLRLEQLVLPTGIVFMYDTF